ncbi:phage virion morphogenesis protein [Yersinia ruckeri]|uniref:Tail completion protein n=3 Tax=Yersinia ruckeri TaxID=29486 RepID=A0A0A8VIC5_YERRU|nr:phage virion morphogenesis protein [Yersinia ruckeri]EEQ00582.1 Tail completion protein [Yersinia ruckeri ATCC 29473]EKN4196721.1 phage virion morphogenesis protein [Yersinia ruckeri]EKN4203375.1 phage virion morphogenesis protein [Yersinia ruckeri]EKN4700784.1 phage virion morphogenesis protein [Yersinia ruckeri]ELI6451457.1 phage virion morphogenesis protein [Yersinia ruckeri]
MDNEFQELEQYLQRLMNRGKSGARHKLSRDIAITLRRGQQQRIRQQLNADGTPYTKRKDNVKTVQKRLRFIYQGTVRDLKNWSGNKCQITGWDNDRNAIRTFNRVDIDRFLSVETQATTKRTSKKQPMFRRLRNATFLRLQAMPDSAGVGYTGVAAKIAQVHQYGGTDQVNPYVKADYPARQLLGITSKDSDNVLSQVFDFIARG